MGQVKSMDKELFVDNFAGGGGASTGIELAIGRSVDIAINHDEAAIKMHKANHPNTKHYCEDVWSVNPKEACGGTPVALAWFSPDCTHFSRAKGGKPVDKKIRGLAWVAIRWAYEVRPRVIMLENVPEIRTWGPLGENNKPIKERAGETFEGFILALSSGVPKEHPAFKEMCEALEIEQTSAMADALSKGLGYDVEHDVLKSCDYGAPTTRTRFYLIARSDGKKIKWPTSTHAPKNSYQVRIGEKLPYRTAAECIDWSIPGKSIFERDKPLCDATLRRIAKGFNKFILNSTSPYIVDNKYLPYLVQYHGETAETEVRGQNIDEPLMTLDTSNRYALIMPYIVTLRNHMNGQAMDEPLSTITTKDHHGVVYAYLIKYYSGVKVSAVDMPLDTLTTMDRFAIVTVHKEDYWIKDIFMRFLTPREMFKATGFPADYIIEHDDEGKPYPRTQQVAKCGNAVTPPVATAMVRANLPEYCKQRS